MKSPSIIQLLASLAPVAATAAQMTDHFDDRPQTGGYFEVLTADTSFASLERDETDEMHGGHQRRTVWAEWIAPESGWVNIDTAGTAFQRPVLAVYTGESITALRPVARGPYVSAATPSSVRIPVQAGQAYQIVLDSALAISRGRGLGQVNIELVPEGLPMTATGADRFHERPRLDGMEAYGVANNALATLDEFEREERTGINSRDVWWQWTAPASGLVTMDTLQSDFDTQLTVFAGSPQQDPPFEELEMVARNHDVPNRKTSRVAFQTEAGRVYQIAVSSPTPLKKHCGNVILKLSLVENQLPPAVPGADLFEKRPLLAGEAAAGVACNTHASQEASEVVPRGDGGRSVWWQWQAPESGRFAINTRGSEANTMLRIYRGGSLDTLEQVGFNDNVIGALWSEVELIATRGEVYQIRVDHAGAIRRNAGNITLNLDRQPAPEIDIQQPARSSLVAGQGKRSFGTARIGRTGATKVFTIRNLGTAPLTGIVVRMVGPGRDFVIRRPATSSLAPGESTTFRVTFKPAAAGMRNGRILVSSDDWDENPFSIRLTGLGVKR